MKTVNIFVELKVPETVEECKGLWDGKGDCWGCAYRLKDITQDCQHLKILEAMDKAQE